MHDACRRSRAHGEIGTHPGRPLIVRDAAVALAELLEWPLVKADEKLASSSGHQARIQVL